MNRDRMITDMLMRRNNRMPYPNPFGMFPSRDFRRGGGRDRVMEGNNDMGSFIYANNQSGPSGSDSTSSQYNYTRSGRDSDGNRQYDMGSRYPFRVEGEIGRYDGNYGMNYNMQFPMNMPYDGHYCEPYYGAPMMNGMPMPMFNGQMDFGGDYGETLNKEELNYLINKLMVKVEDKDRQFFTKEMVSRKAHEMGVNFDKFNEEELLVAALLEYALHCTTLKPLVGPNMDVYIKMGKDFLMSDTENVKGGEKLAIYYDCLIKDRER